MSGDRMPQIDNTWSGGYRSGRSAAMASPTCSSCRGSGVVVMTDTTPLGVEYGPCECTNTICVGGIHLCRIGDQVQVRAEVGGEWRLVISEHIDGPFSHIAEPSGIAAAPPIDLRDDAR
jgi:hypothetical protein